MIWLRHELWEHHDGHSYRLASWAETRRMAATHPEGLLKNLFYAPSPAAAAAQYNALRQLGAYVPGSEVSQAGFTLEQLEAQLADYPEDKMLSGQLAQARAAEIAPAPAPVPAPTPAVVDEPVHAATAPEAPAEAVVEPHPPVEPVVEAPVEAHAPVHAEPVHAEPVRAEPTHVEPVAHGPTVEDHPAQTEAEAHPHSHDGGAQASEPEPVAEPVPVEPVPVEPVHAEPAPVEAAPVEAHPVEAHPVDALSLTPAPTPPAPHDPLDLWPVSTEEIPEPRWARLGKKKRKTNGFLVFLRLLLLIVVLAAVALGLCIVTGTVDGPTLLAQVRDLSIVQRVLPST